MKEKGPIFVILRVLGPVLDICRTLIRLLCVIVPSRPRSLRARNPQQQPGITPQNSNHGLLTPFHKPLPPYQPRKSTPSSSAPSLSRSGVKSTHTFSTPTKLSNTSMVNVAFPRCRPRARYNTIGVVVRGTSDRVT